MSWTFWGRLMGPTENRQMYEKWKNVHIKRACIVSNLHKTESYNSMEALTSFVAARSNFVTANSPIQPMF